MEAYSLPGPIVTNYPAIGQADATGASGFTITWLATPGSTYEIDYSTNLIDWTEAVAFVATNRLSSFTDPTPTTNKERYYRLQELPSE